MNDEQAKKTREWLEEAQSCIELCHHFGGLSPAMDHLADAVSACAAACASLLASQEKAGR